MRFWLRTLFSAVVVVGIAVAGLSYAYWDETVQIGSMAINYVRYWSAPAGTLETEVAQTGVAAQPSTSSASTSGQAAPGDWPSYNKTLTSNRFSQFGRLEVGGPIEVEWPVQGMCQCPLQQIQVEAPQLRGPCMLEIVCGVRPNGPFRCHRNRFKNPPGLNVSAYFSIFGSTAKLPCTARMRFAASKGPGPKPGHTG